jgi:hypothetical protein
VIKVEKRYLKAVKRNIKNMTFNPYARLTLWEAKKRLGIRKWDKQFDEDVKIKLFELKEKRDEV